MYIPAFLETYILSMFLSSPLLFSCIFSVCCPMFIHIAAEFLMKPSFFMKTAGGGQRLRSSSCVYGARKFDVSSKVRVLPRMKISFIERKQSKGKNAKLSQLHEDVGLHS